MVLVTVVMAWLTKTRSAILRLFLAIRMLRRPTKYPKPFKSCCENPAESEDCTLGLKKLAPDVEEERVLFQAIFMVVPGVKLCWYAASKIVECACKPCKVLVPTPVPERNGLFIGVVSELMEVVALMTGS